MFISYLALNISFSVKELKIKKLEIKLN